MPRTETLTAPAVQKPPVVSTADRYDLLRHNIPYIAKPNMLVVTRGIAAEFDGRLEEVLKRVRDFSTFTKDNDPYKEHDFGAFELDEHKIFWKIDDYDGHDGYGLVLTIMLASEY